MPSVKATGEYETFDIGVGLPFADTLSVLADLADLGSILRLELAPDAMNDEEEEYTVIWARDFSVLKSSYPRWLQQELASLKRSAKRGQNLHAYKTALLLGLYTLRSTLGQEMLFRYLRPEDLEHPPEPYPQKSTWNRDAWIPYDPQFLAELAEKQHLDPQYGWLGPALRRAGNSVQWMCGCEAMFLSREEYELLKVEPRTGTPPYPKCVTMIHPTEGMLYINVLPKGRISSVEFVDRAFECSCWDYESA